MRFELEFELEGRAGSSACINDKDSCLLLEYSPKVGLLGLQLNMEVPLS